MYALSPEALETLWWTPRWQCRRAYAHARARRRICHWLEPTQSNQWLRLNAWARARARAREACLIVNLCTKRRRRSNGHCNEINYSIRS